MAQRVLIAGAISCEPDLVIADEPTTALDVTVQADVLDLLRELQQRLNIGVILVTHNFGVVADLCDRVAVMQNSQGSWRKPSATSSAIRKNPTHRHFWRRCLKARNPCPRSYPPCKRSQSHEHHQKRAAAHRGPAGGGVPQQEVPGKALRTLTDINITIGRGETLGLVGESGSGKIHAGILLGFNRRIKLILSICLSMTNYLSYPVIVIDGDAT